MVKMKLRGSTESHTVQAMPIVALGHVNGDMRGPVLFVNRCTCISPQRNLDFVTPIVTVRAIDMCSSSHATLCPSHSQSVTCQSFFSPSLLVGS